MNTSVLSYLEAAALRWPDKKAFSDDEKSYTFEELKRKAEILAARLDAATGGARRRPVLVYLPKSADCIAAFMGILYSGNFYVPADVKAPKGRIEKILGNLQPAAIITEAGLREGISEIAPATPLVDFAGTEEVGSAVGGGGAVPGWKNTVSTDPAYIIYTSGSTGTPKGVVVSHQGILDYIEWAKSCYGVDESDVIGGQAPFYFDNSTLDIYLALSTGAEMHIIPESHFGFPAKLVGYIAEKKITTVFWVPSVLIGVANYDALRNPEELSLRRVLFAGEVMPNRQLNYWRKKLPDALFSNLYGPTEITVDCTYFIVDRDFSDEEPLPIGLPCENTRVLLIDEGRVVEKPLERGEICVGGLGVALGYWRDEAKTRAAFVQNPANPAFDERLYRTGDLGYWNERGELMYCGRMDSQIKLHGYRIEMGEIETAANSLAYIKKSCACFDEARQQIVMYYEAEAEVPLKDLRLDLLKLLPKYMLPSRFEHMAEMPQNQNGKIDRNLLNQKLKAAAK